MELSTELTVVIDGNRFANLKGFYEEIERALVSPGVSWVKNLDALDDVLDGVSVLPS